MPGPISSVSPSSTTAVRRPFAVTLTALALLLGLTSAAVASPGAPSVQSSSALGRAVITELPPGTEDAGRSIYIVTLQSEPLALYRGGAVTSDGAQLAVPERVGNGTLDLDGAASKAYLAYLAEQRAGVLADIGSVTDGAVALDNPAGGEREYRGVAVNAIAIAMTPDQAIAVASVQGVERIEPEAAYRLNTDAGPEWIEAPTVWGETPAAGSGVCELGTCGEGVVVGVIDTGVTPDHASYADVGPIDGYDHNNPYGEGVYFGQCADTTGAPHCDESEDGSTEENNDKLIGMYDFVTDGAVLGPVDDNGHGTHTSSTAAGNALELTLTSPTLQLDRSISGVAPHANIINYKACQSTFPGFECLGADTLAAIEQATEDAQTKGPDGITAPPFVINFSITGGGNPFTDATQQAWLAARDVGVFVAASAGNSGPGAQTVNHNAPWVMTNAASTHNRKLTNGLIDMASEDVDPLEDMFGASFSCGYPQEENDPQDEPIDWSTTECPADFADALPEGTAPIVWAGDYETDPGGTAGDCGAGPPVGADLESSLDPFPGVDFNGAIVVCIRGTYARVDKAEQAANHGAGGFVLINDEASGDSLIADPYAIPGVHLTYEQGQALLEWLESAPDAGEDPVPEDYSRQAAIQGTDPDESMENGDIMASFSSRGPNPTVPDVIKPDITAPGVDILAAWIDLDGDAETDDFNIISGTSMSSPHNAGAAALVRGAHPDWSPAEVQSALMTTSFNYLPGDEDEQHGVFKEDGETLGDPFDFGAGRTDVARAINAGLLMDESTDNYEAADPEADTPGVPSSLNIPSMAEDECPISCSWRRTFEATVDGAWNVTVEAPAGISLTVEPTTFELAAGETQTIEVTASVNGAAPFAWHFGQVFLSPGGLGVDAEVDPRLITQQHLPVAIFVSPPPLGTPELEAPESAGCSYDLTWSDLAADEELELGDEDGYRVQQSTNHTVGVQDDAEGGLTTYWETEGELIVEGQPVPAVGWTESPVRSNSPGTSYWSGNAPGGSQAGSNEYIASLTLAEPFEAPEGASTVVTFASFEDMEPGFDYGYVQASNDDGATWETALVVNGESGEFVPRTADFPGMNGDVLVRFLYVADPLVGLAEGFEGWYVDDIVVSAGTWTDIGDTAADVTTFTVENTVNGTYFYRVAGLVLSGPDTFAVGPWSNIVEVGVECELAPAEPTPTASPSGGGAPSSPTPRPRFIPNTAFDWGPAGLATATSLLILFVSLATVAVPRVISGKERRRKR